MGLLSQSILFFLNDFIGHGLDLDDSGVEGRKLVNTARIALFFRSLIVRITRRSGDQTHGIIGFSSATHRSNIQTTIFDKSGFRFEGHSG